jgi:FKBP-type peptidyl-prolyl cis-trans isomerase
MKKTTLESLRHVCTLSLLLGAPLVFAQPAHVPPSGSPATAPGADPAPPPTPDQIGYLLGLSFGAQMHEVGFSSEFTQEGLSRGVKAGLQGKVPTPAEKQEIQVLVRMAMQSALARNQGAAADFLARNAKVKGVITTASGLQYKIVSAGDKKAPAIHAGDKVTVDYRGTLLDGSEFDSSYSRGMPTTFAVNGVIKGWQEALVLMRPGDKWQLFVPSELAYGDAPRPKIPGASLLIFEVNVLNVEPPPAAAPRSASPPK